MDSARYSIDLDDVFYLEHLPVINSLVEIGLTLFVDKDFPDYHDMTLIQYAIAKRKPKTLRFLLNKAKKELEIKDEVIMYPDTSNTRCSLLKLAIQFGSKSKYYDSEDNSCLEVIISELSIPKQKALEAPLIEAVRTKNNKAIDILIKNDADFFSPLDKKTNDIEDDFVLSEMPIMSLFKLHNNEEELANIFDEVLPEGKSKEIIDRLTKLRVKGKEFISCLSREERAKNFCAGRIENRLEEIRQLELTKKKEEEEKEKEEQNQSDQISTPTPSTDSRKVCSICHEEKDDHELEFIDSKWICLSCKDKL